MYKSNLSSLIINSSEETYLYANIAAKGQVGYVEYPWEKLDELAWFKKEFLC